MSSSVNCEFEGEGPTYRCRRCGREITSTQPADRVHARCLVECEHLGAGVRAVVVECGDKQAERPAYVCTIYGRCLVDYKPTGEAAERWQRREPEAVLYRLCRTCEDFAPCLPTRRCSLS